MDDAPISINNDPAPLPRPPPKPNRTQTEPQMIHLFVEILDRYFGNVCELDIIFNFHKVGVCVDVCV